MFDGLFVCWFDGCLVGLLVLVCLLVCLLVGLLIGWLLCAACLFCWLVGGLAGWWVDFGGFGLLDRLLVCRYCVFTCLCNG